jgi:hypothetical protein
VTPFPVKDTDDVIALIDENITSVEVPMYKNKRPLIEFWLQPTESKFPKHMHVVECFFRDFRLALQGVVSKVEQHVSVGQR